MKTNEIELIRHGQFTVAKFYNNDGDELSLSQDEQGRLFAAAFLKGGPQSECQIDGPTMEDIVNLMFKYGFIPAWDGDMHV